MKKVILSVMFAVFFFTLTSCKDNVDPAEGNVYKTTYGVQYDTLNYLVSSSATDSQFFANNVDGLLENDRFGKLIPSLAKSVKPNDDATEWTAVLKNNNYWYDVAGDQVAEIVADDFVAAADYILNPKYASQVTSMWFMFVEGAKARYCSHYIKNSVDNGETEASVKAQEDYLDLCDGVEGINAAAPTSVKIGIEAVKDNEIKYTLTQSAPFFNTALTYNSFYPVNREYAFKYGINFGENSQRLLYNGAFIMSTDNANELIVQSKNQKYWDKDNVKISEIRYQFYDTTGLSPEFNRNLFENGEITGFVISQDDENGFKKYILGDDNSGTKDNPVNQYAVPVTTVSEYTYYTLFNFNRTETTGTGSTSKQLADVKAALANKSFRQGIFYGMDSTPWRTRFNKDNPGSLTRRTYMMSELATDTSGVDYIDYVYAEYAVKSGLAASNASFATKVEKGKAILADGVHNQDGTDKVMNKTTAANAFAAAKTALQASGVTFPIRIECFAPGTSATIVSYYQSICNQMNADFGSYVNFVLRSFNSSIEWSTASNTQNLDLRFYMGWGPDYADPLTYLNTYIIGGDMVDYSGLDKDATLARQILGEYTDLVKAANKITDPKKSDQRFAALAKAEYKLLFEDAIIVPYYAQNTVQVQVSKTKPYTAPNAPYGLAKMKFKGLEVLTEPVTRAEREALRQEYLAEKNK